jgi:hypothetical protein
MTHCIHGSSVLHILWQRLGEEHLLGVKWSQVRICQPDQSFRSTSEPLWSYGLLPNVRPIGDGTALAAPRQAATGARDRTD